MGAIGLGVDAALMTAGVFVTGAGGGLLVAAFGFAAGDEQRRSADEQGEVFHMFF